MDLGYSRKAWQPRASRRLANQTGSDPVEALIARSMTRRGGSAVDPREAKARHREGLLRPFPNTGGAELQVAIVCRAGKLIEVPAARISQPRGAHGAADIRFRMSPSKCLRACCGHGEYSDLVADRNLSPWAVVATVRQVALARALPATRNGRGTQRRLVFRSEASTNNRRPMKECLPNLRDALTEDFVR